MWMPGRQNGAEGDARDIRNDLGAWAGDQLDAVAGAREGERLIKSEVVQASTRTELNKHDLQLCRHSPRFRRSRPATPRDLGHPARKALRCCLITESLLLPSCPLRAEPSR